MNLVEAMNTQLVIPGYEMKTTFWSDFSIADCFGLSAVKDTYETAFENWKGDIVFLTELVMVLNHKIWYWWDKNGDCPMARLYNDLWIKADQWCMDNLTGEDLTYYLMTTD